VRPEGSISHLHRLIARYGIEAKLFDWSDEMTAECSVSRKKGHDFLEALGRVGYVSDAFLPDARTGLRLVTFVNEHA
jgi:hypothetical protein